MNNLGKKGCYTCDLGNKYTRLGHGSIQDKKKFICRHFTKGVLLYSTCNCLVFPMAGQCSEDILSTQSSILAAFAFSHPPKQGDR